MKMTDLDESINLNEAPLGGLASLGHKLGSYVPGEFGRKSAGKLETGKQANKLKSDFAHYLGQTGIDTPTPQALEDFLKHRGLPTTKAMSTIPAGTTDLEDEQVDAAFLAAIQDSKTAPSTQQQQQPAGNNQQSQPAGGAQNLTNLRNSASQLSKADKRALVSYLISTL